jgi:L-ascorbate metabolism protein UlaG (beta-lactamase superfamily)
VTDGFYHVGNSTHLLVLGGVRVLTDPWLSEPADHVLGHRLAPAPLPDDPDLVLITHAHEDHFDPTALARIDRGAIVVCPASEAKAVRALGFAAVHGVSAGDQLRVCEAIEIEVVRGRHSVPELCYRLSSGSHAVFFGGDTMRSAEIDELARTKPTRFVVLPGEHSALLGRRYVMTPTEAVALARLFRADVAVLTHHETQVIRRWPFGWMVRIAPPDPVELPAWFKIPVPGQFIPFPWQDVP